MKNKQKIIIMIEDKEEDGEVGFKVEFIPKISMNEMMSPATQFASEIIQFAIDTQRREGEKKK